MVVGTQVAGGSMLPSVCEDDEGGKEEELGGIASRPISRPRSLYSRGSVDGQRVPRSPQQLKSTSPGLQEEDQTGEEQDLEKAELQQVEHSVLVSEEFDIDLELQTFHSARQAYDPTGQSRYREACTMLSVVPVSYFLRNMNQPELNLKHWGLGSQGTKALAISLITNTSVLKLNLQDNSMGRDGGAAIAEMLKENCYITDIDLSENGLGDYGAGALSSMLLENSVLLSLNLSGNHLDEQAARHLSPALMGNQKLQQLDLCHNRFGDSAGLILGAAIAENTGLRRLNVAWNCIRGKGATAFAKGLENPSELSFFFVCSNNRIPLEGAIHLALGLKVNTTLQILKMSRNPIQAAGCFAVVKSVQANPESAIEFLDFSDISVDQEFEDLFHSTREIFPNLQVKYGGNANSQFKKT
ncbi:hypothetical protein DNTS_035308 [Danionella cerebrum]|uniref:Leucine-rich repeat-containing protein 74B n=1 Tax=Danionella cerebrum TaxID=2873325 RepID=A0A553QC18_9TELE|nr:hypothetical protein DNTS_035308 [Danionella translucida]